MSDTNPSMIQEVEEKVCAGFAGIYLHSAEPALALEQLTELCVDRKWPLMCWDAHNGLKYWDLRNGGVWSEHVLQGGSSIFNSVQALGAFKTEPHLLNPEYELKANDRYAKLLVLVNGHRQLDGILFQPLINQIHRGKSRMEVVIVLSPILRMPPEYESMKILDMIEHKLPDREALRQIVTQLAVTPEELPHKEAMEKVLDAGAGMTALSFENACALSLYRHENQPINHKVIFNVKQEVLKTTHGLQLYQGRETFNNVGGLTFLKQYCLQVLSQRQANPRFRCRGILVAGVSGGGKSLFAKALGNETDRPTLIFDIGATMGSLLGQTEGQFRRALATADAMAPTILMIDEVEKAMSGVQGSNRTDGGVKAAMFGYFLSWMQDHESDVFVIASANNIRSITDENPEFLRRFDALFFVDFPGRQAKDDIWKIHLANYELWDGQSDIRSIKLPNDNQWTGADIERCCRQSRLRGLPVADVGTHLTTVSDQARETIAEMRKLAARCYYSADYEGIYVPGEQRDSTEGDTPVRKRIGSAARGNGRAA